MRLQWMLSNGVIFATLIFISPHALLLFATLVSIADQDKAQQFGAARKRKIEVLAVELPRSAQRSESPPVS